MLRPNHFKCERLGHVFATFDHLTCLCGGDPPKGPGASGAPTWPEVNKNGGALVTATVPGPTQSQVKLKTLMKAIQACKTVATSIEIYGWYSGPCVGATVGQAWNS